MNDKENVLDFFGFDNKTIVELSYLINLAKQFNIVENFHDQIEQFDKRHNETYPIFYKRMFISEIVWKFNELVCAEYYPEVAIDRIEDFGLFFQDIWLDDEEDNVFLHFILTHNLNGMSNKEIVTLYYSTLKSTFAEYFKTVEEIKKENIDIFSIIKQYSTGDSQ